MVARNTKNVRNLQYLRDANRAAVIKALALGQAESRVELAKTLGLSKMAISQIVGELMEQDIVVETEADVVSDVTDKSAGSSPEEGEGGDRRRQGRTPVRLEVTDFCINAIGIYIYRYQIHCVAADVKGQIAFHEYEMIPENADNEIFLGLLKRLLDKAVQYGKEYHREIVGVGIASIGPLDIYHKHLFYPPNFYQIGDIDFQKELKDCCEYPIYMDNDMNAGALAEYYYGSNNSDRSLAYIGLSSGVGAGIVEKGEILHGSGGFAGEVGHISINMYGPRCSCGQRGCVELYTSISNVLRNAGVASTEELVRLMRLPQPPGYVQNSVRETRDALHTLLITIANMYDPEMIVLGEVPKELSWLYLDGMEEYLNQNMFHHGHQTIEVRLSSLGENAPFLGATSLVFRKFFAGEIGLNNRENKECSG